MEGSIKYSIRKQGLSQNSIYDEDEFRDNIATVDEEGKRIWIYPKKPSGKFHRWRILVTIVLLTLLFAGPFLKIEGQPFLLLNVFERKFVIFGQAFWPQDFVFLAIGLITFFVFVILFTVVFGRVWCGWMCPQTLFMEMVFRKIEYFIEGDANAQRRLAKQPWSISKISKKTAKHFIFIAISVLIAHTLMAYLVGVHETLSIVASPPGEHLAGFIGLSVFSVMFYGVYAKFREQACIAVCPYGRLQGVLLTKESIVVAYDWLRGEPRRHLKKQKVDDTSAGDCVDCKLCVHVCPTGIDIRHGTQLECVNCTACIDACDEVMLKVGKPTGLVRFASYNSIREGVQKLVNARVVGYSIVLVALLSILGFSLATRSDVETTVLKVPGTLYQRENGFITNLYNIECVNKTFSDIVLEIRVVDPKVAELVSVDKKEVVVPAEGFSKSVYFIRVPDSEVTNARTVVLLGVYHNDELMETVKVKFIGPVSKPSDAKRN
ncbi:MAG: cytochrome c oxidase accessory protein CcoG [Bacteroidota bacterium]